MDKEEIIDAYIRHIRSASVLNDEDLKKIISEAIEIDPERLDNLKKILYQTKKIKLTTITCAQSNKLEDNESDIRDTDTEINIYVENGCLSTDELKGLVQCIRDIEQNNTERHIKILMDTPEKSVDEMKDVIGSVSPGFPYKAIMKGSKLSQNDEWTKF